MMDIHVHRYPEQEHSAGWAGWVEPDDLSWILFVEQDGSVALFDERDPATGGVLTQYPVGTADRSGRYRGKTGYRQGQQNRTP